MSSENDNNIKKLWIKRGSRSKAFCFIMCVFFPPLGYYYVGQSMQGVGVLIFMSIFGSLIGNTYTPYFIVLIILLFWLDFGKIFSKNKFY